MMGKIFRLKELKKFLREKTKERKIKTVFTNGCFDLLHVGHIRYLKEARSLGGFLIVGVNGDKSVRALKGRGRPVQPEEARAEVLGSLECVDSVILFKEKTPLKLIQEISPDILVKGGDWNVEDIVGSDHVLSYGGKVRSLQFVRGFSSSDLIKKMSFNFKTLF